MLAALLGAACAGPAAAGEPELPLAALLSRRLAEVDDTPVVTLLAPHREALEPEGVSLLSRTLRSKGRIRADVWTNFDDTKRFGGQLVATTWLRAAIDAEGYAWDQKKLPGPDALLGGTFYTGDVNVVAQLVPHPRGTLRTGLGAAWLVDDAGEFHYGPQATIALDANLLGPATAGFEIDYGQIDGEELFRWRAEGGWTVGPAELRGGYDEYNLGGEVRDGWFASLLLRY